MKFEIRTGRVVFLDGRTEEYGPNIYSLITPEGLVSFHDTPTVAKDSLRRLLNREHRQELAYRKERLNERQP